MRETKYRAWDKENEVMVYSDDNPNDDFAFIVENDGLQFYYIDSDRHLMDTNSIKLQYTGLKDKNGTEIFHKDIVDWIDGEFSFRAVVEDGYWQWYLKGVYPIDNFDFADYTDKNQTDLVIVGNIYENPELLEVTE